MRADPAITRTDLLLLKAGVAIPFLYFGTVALAALFYPGFSLVRQFASELGTPQAPHPQILNVGIIGVGVATLIATVGYWRVLPRLGARPVPARLACYVIGMFGVAMLLAGVFPHPDWRHSGAGLGVPILVGPAFLAAALSRREDARPLRRYLLVTNVVMVVMLVVYIACARMPFVGLCQLLYTLTAIPWMGVSAYVLARYAPPAPPGAEPVPA